jgi:hypothetical protein
VEFGGEDYGDSEDDYDDDYEDMEEEIYLKSEREKHRTAAKMGGKKRVATNLD